LIDERVEIYFPPFFIKNLEFQINCLSLYHKKLYQMKRNVKKQTLLKGEGANQHTLYGEFAIAEKPTDFADLVVKKDSLLKHEQPNGAWSNEHQTLKVDKGNWVMGKQVEFSPFDKKISQVWD